MNNILFSTSSQRYFVWRIVAFNWSRHRVYYFFSARQPVDDANRPQIKLIVFLNVSESAKTTIISIFYVLMVLINIAIFAGQACPLDEST